MKDDRGAYTNRWSSVGYGERLLMIDQRGLAAVMLSRDGERTILYYWRRTDRPEPSMQCEVRDRQHVRLPHLKASLKFERCRTNRVRLCVIAHESVAITDPQRAYGPSNGVQECVTPSREPLHGYHAILDQ